MDYQSLSSFQLDALKEVFNIGTGNAATSLSMLIGSKIDMSVPNMNIVPFDELYNNYNKDNEVVAVLVKVLGEIEGGILYVFTKDVAINIISKMLTNNELNELTEMGLSIIGEIGNIISSSFMNAIAEFTKMKITASVPAVVNDMMSSIFFSTFLETGQYDEYVLDIETLFIGEEDNNIEGHFYFIPSPGALEKILKSIGIE